MGKRRRRREGRRERDEIFSLAADVYPFSLAARSGERRDIFSRSARVPFFSRYLLALAARLLSVHSRRGWLGRD